MVPNLKGVAIAGDSRGRQTVFRHFLDDLPSAVSGVEVIDLTGLPMRELRQRAAVLPDHTAILYTSIYSDGEGTYYSPADALALLAQTSSRPIVVAADTFVGPGGIGGFVMDAPAIGEEAAKLALRILDGESASNMPAAVGNTIRPLFDWRQMQRWEVSEASLPPGSEIRFREATAWERYRWQIVSIIAVLLIQTALIIGLMYEHRRRRKAEFEGRRRLSELAHMNRHATAGELSASLAHEINQPLGAILNNSEAATVILDSSLPDLDEIKTIINEVRRDTERAAEIINRLRGLLRKSALKFKILISMVWFLRYLSFFPFRPPRRISR